MEKFSEAESAEPSTEPNKSKLGTLAGTITFMDGWNNPMTDEEFAEFINHGNL